MSKRKTPKTSKQQTEICRCCLAEAVRKYIRTANRKELQEIIGLASIELHNPFLADGDD